MSPFTSRRARRTENSTPRLSAFGAPFSANKTCGWNCAETLRLAPSTGMGTLTALAAVETASTARSDRIEPFMAPPDGERLRLWWTVEALLRGNSNFFAGRTLWKDREKATGPANIPTRSRRGRRNVAAHCLRSCHELYDPRRRVIHYSVNLTLLWPELPVLERFHAATRADFRRVEILFVHDQDLDGVERLLHKLQLELVLFDPRPGDWAKGKHNLLSLPGREAEFLDTVREAIASTRRLRTTRLNCLA